MNDTTFEELVLKSPVPVMVDFWAPWCGPCRMIAPLIDELAVEYGDKLRAVRCLPGLTFPRPALDSRGKGRKGWGSLLLIQPAFGHLHDMGIHRSSYSPHGLLSAASCADLAFVRCAAEAEHRREPWSCDRVRHPQHPYGHVFQGRPEV